MTIGNWHIILPATQRGDAYHAIKIKKHKCSGNNSGNNSEQLICVTEDSNRAGHQGSREGEHYQQHCKCCKRIASARLQYEEGNDRGNGYCEKSSRYFSKTHLRYSCRKTNLRHNNYIKFWSAQSIKI